MNTQPSHYEQSGNWKRFCNEHEAVASWLIANPHNRFAVSLADQVFDKGYLSPKQISCVERNIEKAKSVRATADVGSAFTGIIESFTAARDSGLKKPGLVIGDIKLSLAPEHSRNAGYLYVKEQGTYAGKISPAGKFSKGWDASDDIVERLEAIGKDPQGEAIKHGKETGQCACCGRELTDEKSVAAGIGPVCAKRWGFGVVA